jgi:hypothetical protein
MANEPRRKIGALMLVPPAVEIKHIRWFYWVVYFEGTVIGKRRTFSGAEKVAQIAQNVRHAQYVAKLKKEMENV